MENEYFTSNNRISDLISQLEKLKAEHGDLVITHNYLRGGVRDIDLTEVKVAYIRPKEKREKILAYRIGIHQVGDLKVLRIL
ncbi:TPA: head morphogeneis protein [Neisseria subflava]|uniref:head morphogeneis protein n=1 Tax=Neisseria sp. P0007.S010 TaxID=3436697 RepID=UPI0028896D01|nr:head morphogeneis protein [uncultured Neisseria sp.]MCL6059641.1 head morphogeneis protein [Neisseria meningitidis]